MDDFVKSLKSGVSDGPKCQLLHEIFGTLLGLVCRDYISKKSSSISSSTAPTSPPQELPSSWGSIDDSIVEAEGASGSIDMLSSDGARREFEDALGDCSEDEVAAIFQWYKWMPGKWATGGVARFKYWEVALIGYVKDCGGRSRWKVCAEMMKGEPGEEVAEVMEDDDIGRKGGLSKSTSG